MFPWWVTRPYVICHLFALLFHLQLHLLLLSPSRPHRCLFPQMHQAYLCLMASALASYSLCSEHCSLRQSTPSNPGSGLTFPRRPGLTILCNTAVLLCSTLPFQMGLFTHLYYLLIYDAYWWLIVCVSSLEHCSPNAEVSVSSIPLE